MKINGASFATLASIPITTRVLIIELETIHQKLKFSRYFAPEVAWC